jgi:DNA-binding transcriptional ArsR family regulator
MQKALKQFVVRQLKDPTKKQIDKDIEWVCNSLGFVTSRDQDKTALRILKALIKSAKEGKGMTSEELTKVVKPTIGSVFYHLKKLMKAELVVKLDSKYELRMNSLLTTIEEIEKEVSAALGNIKKIAKDIDDKIGLEHR